jgi:SAM-dependent methyltransferase
MSTNTYALEAKDSSSYEAGYDIFLKRSDFRDRIAQKFEELAKGNQQTETLKVLDVGCGNGEMTKRYLASLKTRTNNIELCLTEPALASLELSKDMLKSEANIVYAGGEPPETGNFDFIIASYVFYHLSPLALASFSEQLNINGSMAIMMGTSDNPFKTHPGLSGSANHGSSDKLQPLLTRLEQTSNFKVTRYKVDTFLNLNGLRNDSGINEEGKKLLSFSLNKDYATLSETALLAVDDIYSEAFEKNAGKVKSVHEIIWIERQR